MVDETSKGGSCTQRRDLPPIRNYIDTDAMILRKGAVRARQGERLLIPINMRDGSLICVGKGNEGWNYSAPHGAGRLMSRGRTRSLITTMTPCAPSFGWRWKPIRKRKDKMRCRLQNG